MICNLCPRRCGALRDETHGEGRCGMPGVPVLARAALHRWEEPPVSGVNGSGAVFFSGCPLGCVFCQNDEISRQGFGKPVTEARLGEIFRELVAQGAHNINLVSPTHYAHVLRRVLAAEKPPVPVVWNTGGYERVETLRGLEGLVDVYLPDLKYLDSEAAARYSGAADYPEAAQAAILEMYRQTGPVVLEGGLIKRGVIIRHLVLPGQLAGARAVMDWVAETFPPGGVLFSLMSQYIPCGRAAEYPEIDRPLRRAEARKAREYMADLGLEGFVQEDSAASAGYIPSFDLSGVEGE
ncbi:MAG: radical SAM protein [Clostridiales bacterium]|nr:radical SAM protein [Clostridiales bacterium]